jgi:hypothetical protein
MDDLDRGLRRLRADVPAPNHEVVRTAREALLAAVRDEEATGPSRRGSLPAGGWRYVASMLLAAAVIVGCLQPSFAQGVLNRTPLSGWLQTRPHTTYRHTQSMIRKFVRAYDQHNIGAVLALFTPKLQYADCDYAHSSVFIARDKAELRHWLARRFADADRFTHVSITTANPEQRYVGGLSVQRTSRLIAHLHVAPLHVGSKMVLREPTFSRFTTVVWIGPEGCSIRGG